MPLPPIQRLGKSFGKTVANYTTTYYLASKSKTVSNTSAVQSRLAKRIIACEMLNERSGLNNYLLNFHYIEFFTNEYVNVDCDQRNILAFYFDLYGMFLYENK